ncbi:MAG: tetratricopeptide repeat protein [Spirochaetes bacterium]|nr:tetratricopeptide repeat protein [Spirochaetota bacterium]
MILLPCAVKADAFEAEQNFRSAMTAFKEKNFYSARLLLQEIVLKDARGEYGDDAQYYLAMSYFYEGDYKTAQFEFKALMRDFPESPFVVRAAFWNGESWFYRKQYREALEAHAAFVRKYRENVLAASALYTMGFIYNEQKRYDEAVETLNRALKDYPQSTAAPALTLQLGIAHFNAQEYAKARRVFETLMVKYVQADNLDQARFWLGKSYYAENKYSEALREFATVVKDHGASATASEALYLSALCKYKTGAPDEALGFLAQTVKDYPQSAIYPFARLREGQLLFEKKDLAGALPPLLDIINNHRGHETFPPALELMAEIRRKQGKTDEALATFEGLRQEKTLKGKSRREMLRHYGDLLYQENRHAKAIEVLSELTEEFGDETDGATYYLLLARAQYREGKYEAAQKSLTRLEKNFDDDSARAEALFLKAEISYGLGKFTEALQLYARVAKKYPGHAKVFEAEMGIGWVYFELKQYARAGDAFRKILKTYKKPPQQAKALIALGACQYNLRDLEGALASYNKVISKYDGAKNEAAEAQYQIAWLAFRRNKFEEADKEFEKYLALGDLATRVAEATYFDALCRYQLADYPAAAEKLRAVYARSDAAPWLREKSLSDLARAEAAQKNHAAARTTYLQLIKEFPETQNRDEVEFQLVALGLKLNDEGGALDWSGSLKRRNKTSTWYAESLRELADYYRRKKNYAAAEKTLSELEAAQKKPAEKLEVLVSRAQVFADQGKNDAAGELLRKVLANEEVSEATAMKAATLHFQILEKAGKYAEAEAQAAKLSDRFADNNRLSEEMLLHQAKFQHLQKKYAESREILSVLAKSRNAGQRARYLIAESYRLQGDSARALDYYRQISQKQDESTYLKARFHIGEILYARQEYEEAAREFSRIAYAETRDDAVYEKALYRAALAFKQIKKDKEFETFRAKLKEAFPQSAYLKELL